MTWGLIEKDDITVPCPFCGKVDLIMISRDRDENYVSCQDCMGEGPISETPESALVRWNKRTDVSIQVTKPASEMKPLTPEATNSKDYANGNHPDPYKRADAGECDAHGSTVIDGECGFCPPDRTSVWTPAETTQAVEQASHEWQQAWTTHLEGFDTLDLRDAFKAGAEWWYRNARWTQEEIDEAGVRAKEMMVAIGEEAPADYEDLKRQLAAAVEYGKTFKLAWEEVVKKTTEQLVHEVDEGYCNTCDNEAEMGKCYSGKASEMDSKQHGRTARNGSVASTGPVDYSSTTLGAPEQENLKIAEEVSKEARLAFVEWKKTRGERTPLGCFAAGYVSRPDIQPDPWPAQVSYTLCPKCKDMGVPIYGQAKLTEDE